MDSIEEEIARYEWYIKTRDMLNPNKIIEKVINEKYGSVCPFCGERSTFFNNTLYGLDSKGIANYAIKTWTGYSYEPYTEMSFAEKVRRRHSEKKYHHWKINSYLCHTCVHTWNSQEFPTDWFSEEDIDRIVKPIIGDNPASDGTVTYSY